MLYALDRPLYSGRFASDLFPRDDLCYSQVLSSLILLCTAVLA